MTLALPESNFERPEMVMPWRQPTGPVRVRHEHPLAKDLRLFPLMSNGGIDVVNGVRPILLGAAIFVHTDRGIALRNGLNVADGLSFQWRSMYTGMHRGLTIGFFARRLASSIGSTGNETLVACVGGGPDPFSLSFSQSETFNLTLNDESDTSYGASQDYSSIETEWTVFWARWDGDQVQLWKDDVLVAAGDSFTGPIATASAQELPIYIGTDGGSGSWYGEVLACPIWGRGLSLAEMQLFIRSPWSMLEAA